MFVRSLRGVSNIMAIGAFIAGGFAVWLWMHSDAAWKAHRDAANLAGISAYSALQNGTLPSTGVSLQRLSPTDQSHAAAGDFSQIAGAPHAARVTNIPISADAENTATGAPLTLVILSPDLVYPLANLPNRNNSTAAEVTGAVFRLLAFYCSDPIVIAHYGNDAWVIIDGTKVWNCDVAPTDWRLASWLLAIISVGVLVTTALNLFTEFTQFAEQLRNRRRVGGPSSYDIEGPKELQEIVSAVNSYLEIERAQLESRAAVLSGVSHDLGTPATRLRLRVALIDDAELRQKLEADIDNMTGMIESVLTYTRSEMNAEAPTKLSLTALIESIVDDYQDLGRAVTLRPAEEVIVQGGSSVFMSRQGKTVLAGDRQLTVTGRPISLQRAITNLIDNALKYGRRATVALQTTPTTATIIVEDQGSDSSAKEIEALMAPFKRGDNTTTIDGYGLGLTIVATIANLHGGSLSFEDTAVGVSAHLTIQRN